MALVMVDQHSAHERVLFEEVMAQLNERRRGEPAAAAAGNAASSPTRSWTR